MTELPYDFSQLLKKFDTKNVTLGHNRWMCSCHAEITGRGLQRKIQDQQEVIFYGFFTFELCSERLWLWLDQRPIRGQYVPQKLEENSESEPTNQDQDRLLVINIVFYG